MQISPFLNWRIFSVGFLGIPNGTLFVLLMSTTQIWLSEEGISKTTIGLFALVTLPNALKFLWAPIIDQLQLPFLTKWLGRRRSWAIFAQIGLIFSLLFLGMTEPAHNLGRMVFFLGLVSFFGATQEIVLDAYRIEILTPAQYSIGITSNVLGYRVGTIIGGAGSLYVANYYGWFWVYASIAFCISVSMLILFMSQDPTPIETDLMKEREEKALLFLRGHKNLHGTPSKILAWLYAAVGGPFSEFTKRQDWMWILFLILIYRLGDNLIHNMANIFYLEIGYTKIEIANVTKFFGVFATILGGIIGGIISARFGFLKGLLICGSLHTCSNTMFIVQANFGPDIWLLYAAIAIENITGGMSTTAFVTYLSSLCHKSFTGTQYALLSALWYLSTNFGAMGGFFADRLSWSQYFTLAVLIALPGLSVLFFLSYLAKNKADQTFLHACSIESTSKKTG